MTEKSEQPQPEEGMGAMEEACFQIIASVGTAKSLFIEAIGQAKAGKFDGFATFIRLKWTGTEFIPAPAE